MQRKRREELVRQEEERVQRALKEREERLMDIVRRCHRVVTTG